MTDEREAPKIYQQLVDAAKDIGWVGKTGQNREQGYNFRGIDAVLQHVAPAFRRHGVVVTPEVMRMDESEITSRKGATGYRVTLLVAFHFWSAIDGSEVVAITAGEGMDYSDKATNKAMSQAFKYALVQTLALPTDEPEADSESPTRVSPGEALGLELTSLLGSKDKARAAAKHAAHELGIALNALTMADVKRIVEFVTRPVDDSVVRDQLAELLGDQGAFLGGTIPEIEQRVRVLYELMEALGIWKGDGVVDALHVRLKQLGIDHFADIGRKADIVAFATKAHHDAVSALRHPALALVEGDDDAE